MTADEPILAYRFLPVDSVHHGDGAAVRLPHELDRLGLRRALVLTGNSLANETGLLWYVEHLLGPRHAASYSGVRAHVPSGVVDEAAELAQLAGIDCLVSLGGGSATDTAKAVAHRLAQQTGAPPPAIAALPTTLSAAEFTHYYGVTDEASHAKHGAGDHSLVPRVVFLDPRLTLATPLQLWLSTGIKALDHAIEVYLSPRAHPVTDVLAREAITQLFRWLPVCHAAPERLDARLTCQLAAWMSLFSPATVRGGLSHAVGHQLGGHGVPHGITSCVTLPQVLQALAPRAGQRAAELAAVMQSAGASETTAAAAVSGLVARLGLPARLRDTGLPAEAVATVAGAAALELGARAGGIDLAELVHRMW